VTLVARFEPEASADLEHAALWYQRQRSGLGLEFLEAVDRAVAMVQRWPHAAPLATDLPKDLLVRRAPVKTFPYRVVYLTTPDAIRVLAIAHEARTPNYWVNRLQR
jgi:plasmid stabilization system protein ParE